MLYWDHHAATPISARALEAMRATAGEAWANPSSAHAAGRASKRILEQARDQVAGALGAKPADVVFTSGGTEACQLGMFGLAKGCRRVVTTAVEHPAVAGAAEALGKRGLDVIRLAVPLGVAPSVDALAESVDDRTLVALQWVNHETGTLFSIEAYLARCRETGARTFIDASQALGKLPIDVEALGADAVAFTSQKIGGPSGAGALWVRRDGPFEPIVEGGGQERGRRSGTPDVTSLAGFGAACEELPARLRSQARIAQARDEVEAALVDLGGVPNAPDHRVATVTNVSFAGWKGAELVAALDVEGVCVSAGAACSSGLQEPSPVISHMYPDEQWRAGSAVRVSFGHDLDPADIELGLQVFRRVLGREAAKT